MATMEDYDNAEPTKREKKSVKNQNDLTRFNAESTKNQARQQIEGYDFANAQNRDLADLELKQNLRKAESDRFNAQRDLQNSALGIMGSLGQAGNSSTVSNFMRMLESRNDRDNDTYWQQLQTNQDAVNNAYIEAYNQNQASKNDVLVNTEKALRDMQADNAANLNNINPSLYVSPSKAEGKNNLGGTDYYKKNAVPQNNATLSQNNALLSGYIMPDNYSRLIQRRNPRNRLSGNDYYSQLINGR